MFWDVDEILNLFYRVCCCAVTQLTLSHDDILLFSMPLFPASDHANDTSRGCRHTTWCPCTSTSRSHPQFPARCSLGDACRMGGGGGSGCCCCCSGGGEGVGYVFVTFHVTPCFVSGLNAAMIASSQALGNQKAPVVVLSRQR